METKKKTLNNSIAKAFTLLEHFTEEKSEWGVRELALKLKANKSTTYRLMATLVNLKVLRQDPVSEKYSLGLKLFELGNRVNIQSAFVSQTHPELKKVATEITETVHLGILKNNQVFMVDKIESPKGLKLNSTVGMFSPLHCTSLGKILLASLSTFELEKALKQITLIKNTAYTITKKAMLRKHLKQIAAQGYAIDKEELEVGLICVAVPVLNKNQEVIAALSAAGPANRFREEAVSEYVAILQKGATAIQAKVGSFKP